MPSGGTEQDWSRFLGHAAHEVSSPLSVMLGYLRMLLTERLGPLPDGQRRMLQEIEKSCAQLSLLVSEFRTLSQLEGGTAKFNRSEIDVAAAVADAVAALPPLPDRDVGVDVTSRPTNLITGDASRLRTALTSVLIELRRGLVTSDRLAVLVEAGDPPGRVRIVIGEPEEIERLRSADATDLKPFKEWHGGDGLRVSTARRIIEAHCGKIWSPVDDKKAAAVISLTGMPEEMPEEKP